MFLKQNASHPSHPSAEELPAPHGASLHGRVAGAFAARSAAPSLRGWGPVWPDQGGGHQNQFLPAERGGNKFTNWDTYAVKWYDDMKWVIWTKESVVFCQPNSGVNQGKVELTWTKAEIEAPRIWIQPALSWLIPREKGKPLDRQEQQQTLNCSKCSF